MLPMIWLLFATAAPPIETPAWVLPEIRLPARPMRRRSCCPMNPGSPAPPGWAWP